MFLFCFGQKGSSCLGEGLLVLELIMVCDYSGLGFSVQKNMKPNDKCISCFSTVLLVFLVMERVKQFIYSSIP